MLSLRANSVSCDFFSSLLQSLLSCCYADICKQVYWGVMFESAQCFF